MIEFYPPTLDWPPHITTKEMSKSGGIIQIVPHEMWIPLWYTAWQAEYVRSEFNQQLLPVSAFRSIEYNRSKGRNDTSQHVLGKAIDFRIKGIRAHIVRDAILDLMSDGTICPGGVGYYKSNKKRDAYVHMDCRGVVKRWAW